MQKRNAAVVFAGALVLSVVGAGAAAADPDGQHGTDEGHLIGNGAWGGIELVNVVDVTDTPDLIADVAFTPDGDTAFLANWGEPDCAGPEPGGQNSPDAGAYVIDISDIKDGVPGEQVGFIPAHQGTRPGEGMQVVNITTAQFSGDVLFMNNEACGRTPRAACRCSMSAIP